MLRSPGFYTGGGSVGSVGIDVYTVSGETDLLGKKASELMEGITVEGDTVTGMLNYVTGYTGFHGSDPEEQEGNYLALLFRADGYQLSASYSGGKHPDSPVPLDGDGIYLLRVSEPGQTITVHASRDSSRQSRTLNLAVTLKEKE